MAPESIELKKHEKLTFNQLTKTDFEYLKQLPRYRFIPAQNTIVLHGGVEPSSDYRSQTTTKTTEIQEIDSEGIGCKRNHASKSHPWARLWNGPQFVVYGHTPQNDIASDSYAFGIDTGCVYGGKLTAYTLETQEYLQVPAKKAYADSKWIQQKPKPEFASL